MAVNAKSLTNEEYFYGHKACGGCGASLAIRLALKIFGKRTFAAVPPNCMSTVGFIYPNFPFFCNAIIPPFAATGSVMSGILAGAKALGLKDYNVIGFAGDGGTADIGLQSLSGVVDRKEKITYICYDNEAYMNTGVQKSGLTPYGSKTTNTPVGKNIHGCMTTKKNMFEIMAAHDIAYAATASVGYPEDLLSKLEKAKNCTETSYIHIFTPCPTGWGTPSDVTIDLAKDAVDCGLWFLAEYENGEFTVNKNPEKFTPVKDYLKKQGRFSHLTEEDIEIITEQRDAKWQKIRTNWIK